MKKTILFLLVLLFTFTNTYSQMGEGNWWFFGLNAGAYFDYGATNTPSGVGMGQCSTYEGCASISDPSGNLLFYTDGITVWNANHVVMFNGNGLGGNSSSTQSGVIVPKPQNPDNYYIFTVDANLGSDGFRFSEVDMTLGGGFGGVIAATKNTLLFTPSLEKIAAVNHANGSDIWVIGHQWSNQNFVAYLVTPAGVPVASPVISSIGHNYAGGGSDDTRGYMKPSPNGDKIALGIEGENKYELYDFDNATGQLSNLLTLFPPASIGNFNDAYGVEFSPDGQLLYGSRRWGAPIFQWNLNAGTPAGIQASCIQIGSLGGGDGGAVQLGLDNKIYLARDGQTWLARIDNPNILGAGCGFVLNGVNLVGKQCREGLPTFIASYFNVAEYAYDKTCITDITEFQITNTTMLDSALWNFDDPGSGIMNTSTIWDPLHQFSQPGDFDVMLITYRGGYPDTAIQTITIHPLPDINLGNDTLICNGGILTLNAGNPGSTYLWSTGATTQTITITPSSATTYYVDVESEHGCASSDTINIDVYQVITEFTVTDIPCLQDPIDIVYTGNADPNAIYDWNFSGANINSGSGVGPYNVFWTNPGSYTISLTISQGTCISPPFSVTVVNPPTIQTTISSTDVLCNGGSDGTISLTVDGGSGNYSFSWTSGHSTNNITGVPAGNYTVTVTYDSVCTTVLGETVNEPATYVSGTLSVSDIDCYGDTDGNVNLSVTGGIPPYSYTWSNASISQNLMNVSVGPYFVTIYDAHECPFTTSIIVEEPEYFDLEVNPNLRVCIGQEAMLNAEAWGGTPSYTYQWENGETSDTIIVQVAEETTFSVQAVDANGCISPSRDVTVKLYPPLKTFQFTSKDTLCPGDSTLIYFDIEGGNGGPYTHYLADGSEVTSPFIMTPEQSTIYTMVSTDNCGTPPAISILPVHVLETPEVDFTTDIVEGCLPLSVSFQNLIPEDGNEYLWYFGENDDYGYSVEENPIHTYQKDGIYDIKLKILSKYGCESSKEVLEMINVFPKPFALFEAHPEKTSIIRSNILFENLSEDYLNAYWDFDDGDSAISDNYEHVYRDTGWFNVKLIVENREFCTDTVTFPVYIEDEYAFWAPTAIHPYSENAENMVFMPKGRGIDPNNFHMIITDRWGEKVFETYSTHHGWDGKINNGEMGREGSYMWYVNYKDLKGNEFFESGSVTLLR